MRWRWRGAATLLLALAGRAKAQQPPASPLSEGGGLRVSILTIGPGKEVWELWGHNTIVVTDRDRGSSLSYNWGLFNFHQEDFILRFARGQMWYSMGSRKADRDLALYVYRNRSMVLQDLVLTPEQGAALQEFLAWNDTDANRFYHYNYYLDNCSTRLRDAIDSVLGGQLKARFDTMPSGHTWRWETRRILGWNLPLYILINLALGQPVDTRMTAWQAMFLPVRLAEYLRTAQIMEPDGQRVSLVREEETLNQSSRFVEPAAPRRTWVPLALLGLLGGGMLLWLGRTGATSRRARRWFGGLSALWSFLTGFLGVLLLFLWFFTDHWTSRYNENVLLLTPISLLLVVLIPLALRKRADSPTAAIKVASVVAGLAAMALVMKVLPWFHQYNLELIALILPVHAGLLWGLKRATTPA